MQFQQDRSSTNMTSAHWSSVVKEMTLKEEFYKQMNHWISKGKLAVIATQVVNEGSNMEVYEVGWKVKKDFNLIEAYDMTLEATVTKLMYLMKKYGSDYQAIKQGFYQPINNDIAKPEM